MPVNISLQLNDDDLAYFTRLMDAAWERNASCSEQELIAKARAALAEAYAAKVPEYIALRLRDIGVLLDLLDDSVEWPLDAQDRRRIVAAIAYFATREDLIPDQIPALGYLDDALVAELVVRELEQDLEAYREFCAYRENEATTRAKDVTREDWLAAKRELLFDRLRLHRERMWEHRRARDLTHPILRYQY